MAGFKKEINRFNYQPRYYKGEGNPYEFKHKFDTYRTSVGKNKSLKAKLTTAYNELKSDNFKLNKTIIIIAISLALIFLYIIDFELSIFIKH